MDYAYDVVYSRNLDLYASQKSELVSNLEPVTSYAVEIYVSNGMMEDNQVILINTTEGMCVCVHACAYVCIHACVHVCMRVHVCVCMGV